MRAFLNRETVRRWSRLLLLGGVGVLIAAPGSVLACAACYGASDAPMARGMNWGILSLLAIIGVVLGGVLSFFVYLGVRAANTATPAKGGPKSPEKL